MAPTTDHLQLSEALAPHRAGMLRQVRDFLAQHDPVAFANIADATAADLRISPCPHQGISRSAHDIYIPGRAGDFHCVAKITLPRAEALEPRTDRDAAERFKNYLHENGIPVPQSIGPGFATESGECHLSTYIRGAQVQNGFDLSSARIEQLAAFVGRLHQLGSQFEASEGRSILGSARGFIHADLKPLNLFFNGDEVCGLVDFELARDDRLIHDLTALIRSWFMRTAIVDGHAMLHFDAERTMHFLSEYQKHRPLSSHEASKLFPLLIDETKDKFRRLNEERPAAEQLLPEYLARECASVDRSIREAVKNQIVSIYR